MAKKVLIILLILLFATGYITTRQNVTDLLANTEELYTQIKTFTTILETIQRAYVDETKTETLIEDAIRGVTSKLDPHTVYLHPDDFKTWNRSFEGYTGIGIGFEIVNGEVTVMSVIAGGPGEKQGIEPGDKILAVNGEMLTGLKKEDIKYKIIGNSGTGVNLTVARSSWESPKKLHVVREQIKLSSVTHSLMLKPDIGYIKIERFTAKTSRELNDAVHNLQKRGMAYLILDLRGNGGGYLNAAIEVTDRFIPGGYTLLTTRGRLASSSNEYVSTDLSTFDNFPLTILIDHGSASASEIVAGAIQDLDRGLIVGKTSFGKGLVQSQYRFHDGSALLITTAKYYTPSGRQIQREYFDRSRHQYYSEAYNDEAILKNHNLDHQKRYTTLSGRTVYGGGGIFPDIWIDNDENILSPGVRKIYFSEKRYIYSFAERIAKKNHLLRMSQNDFIDSFVVTDDLCYDFLNYVGEDNSELSAQVKPEYFSELKFLIKRELSYILFGKEAQFRVNLSRDKQLKKALSLKLAARNLSESRL